MKEWFKIPPMPGVFPTVSSKRFAVFCSQLRGLIKAGITIPEGLSIIADSNEYSKAFTTDLNIVREHLLGGEHLSDSFRSCPGSFPDLFCTMLYSAEISGDLEQVLEESSGLYKAKAEQQGKTVSLLFYPCVVMVFAFAVLAFLTGYVLPVFESSFSDAGMEMPLLTRVVTACAGAAVYLIPLLAAILAAAGLMISRRCKADEHFAREIGRYCLKVPVFGKLQYYDGLRMLAGVLEILLRTGITLPEALRVASETAQNRYLASVYEDVRTDLYIGKRLSESLDQTKIFEPVFMGMVRLGEKTGDFEGAMSSVKAWYSDVLAERTDRYARMAEPVMIGFLGIIVGIVMLALFLPVLQNYQSFSTQIN